MNPQVDHYLTHVDRWQNELKLLREVILECGLAEEFKWMHPCYTFQKKNVVLIHEFKDYCAMLFYKGVLLKDTERLLIQQTKNVQSARQMRFTTISEIKNRLTSIRSYIYEAIEVERAGLKVKLKSSADFSLPEELKLKFEENPALKEAFDNLTPGRQKGYILHFSNTKQAATRITRIEKNSGRILMGKGLRDCICGHSKRLPNCDGSHKLFN